MIKILSIEYNLEHRILNDEHRSVLIASISGVGRSVFDITPTQSTSTFGVGHSVFDIIQTQKALHRMMKGFA